MLKYEIVLQSVSSLVFRLCEKAPYAYQLKDVFRAVCAEYVFKSNLLTIEIETTKGILFPLTLKL